jgi:hypothetical protein
MFVYFYGSLLFIVFFTFAILKKLIEYFFRMKKNLLFFYLVPFLLTGYAVSAQDQSSIKVEPFVAEQKFIKNNYEGALDDYLSLLEEEPQNEKYNYNIAVCYLNTNIDKTKAIPYLEKITSNTSYDPNALYLLGRAYSYAYKFDDALKAYNKFRRMGKGTDENLADVERQIQFCINAKELVKFPVDASFENLGGTVNSPYADYYAYVPSDESFIIFNSRRPIEGAEKLKEDGSYPAGIYMSKVSEGKFIRAKSVDAPIPKVVGEQEVIGLTGNGDMMLIYYTNDKGVGDIYSSTTDRNQKVHADKLGENINSPKAHEIAASINTDGSTLYFASNREGGLGGTDIYKSQKLPNGKWGPAQNLGPEINTPYNEDFPNISPDGTILYFSSDGYTSMGGYDIFKATLNTETNQFSNPRNLGYPINSPMDNYNFRVSNTGQFGYMAAVRPGGRGDLDIYRIKFNAVEPLYSIVKGNLYTTDSTVKINYLDIDISVTNSQTNQLVGTYLPNPISGRYVMALAPGEYDINFTLSGFKPINKKMVILDKISFKSEITDDITFVPILNNPK